MWCEGDSSVLLERVLTHANIEEASRLELLVAVENEIGRSFYESTGFKYIGVNRLSAHGGETDM